MRIWISNTENTNLNRLGKPEACRAGERPPGGAGQLSDIPHSEPPETGPWQWGSRTLQRGEEKQLTKRQALKNVAQEKLQNTEANKMLRLIGTMLLGQRSRVRIRPHPQ